MGFWCTDGLSWALIWQRHLCRISSPSHRFSIPSKWTRRVWVANCCWPPLSSSFNASTAKRGCLGRGKVFGWPPAICPPKRPRPFTHYRDLVASTHCQEVLTGTDLRRQTKPHTQIFLHKPTLSQWGKVGKFREFRETSGELSGNQWGFVRRLIGILDWNSLGIPG